MTDGQGRPQGRSGTLLGIFENLGAPLVGAIAQLRAWQRTHGEDDDRDTGPADDARIFSELLGRTVSLGSRLSGKMPAETQVDADDLRLRTCGIVAQLVARQYVQDGQSPDDAAQDRIAAAFDALLSFADSIVPDQPTSEIDAAYDPVMARIEALAPLALIAARFTFGEGEHHFMMRLGNRLQARVQEIDAVLGEDGLNRQLPLLKACAGLLAASCESELQILQSRGQERSFDDALETVWERFETALALITGLIGYVGGEHAVDEGEADTRKPAAQARNPHLQTQPQSQAAEPAVRPQAAPAAPAAAVTPQAAPQPAGAAPGNFNPMSFFKKNEENPPAGGQQGNGQQDSGQAQGGGR